MATPKSLCLVDDDEAFRERLAEALRARGVDVQCASNAQEALALLRGRAFDGLLTDLKMPGDDGLGLLRQVVDLNPRPEIVVLTGYGSVATTVEAMRLGARNVLIKPCHADAVLGAFDDEAFQDEADLTLTTPSLARLEREHIERVLVECGGNISKAARVLGIHRRTLQYKLSKFPVSR